MLTRACAPLKKIFVVLKIIKYTKKLSNSQKQAIEVANQYSTKKAIIVEEKSFNLREELEKSIDSMQSYVHLKITKNVQKRLKF